MPASPKPSHQQMPALAENRVVRAATGCGCGLLFLGVGILPLLVLLNIFPREEYFGGRSPLLPVLGSLPFAVVGLYFIANAVAVLLRAGPLPGRLLLNVGLFTLALPLHYWLFFGKATEGSTTGVRLPGGLFVSFFATTALDTLLAKVALAVLLFAVDLYLISEVFRLGWFVVKFDKRR